MNSYIENSIEKYEEDCLIKKSFSHVPQDLLDNYEFMHHMVLLNGYILKFASDNIKNNKNIILKAIERTPLSYKYASNNLKNDLETAIECVKRNGENYLQVSENLKNNKKLLLLAISSYPYAIKYASKELSNDIDIIKSALYFDPSILLLYKDRIYDRNLVLYTLTKKFPKKIYEQYNVENKNYSSNIFKTLSFIMETYNDDKKIVILALMFNKFIYNSISERLKNYENIITYTLKSRYSNYFNYPPKVYDCEELMKPALLKNHILYYKLSYRLRNNKNIALTIVKNPNFKYSSLTYNLKNDFDVLKEYVIYFDKCGRNKTVFDLMDKDKMFELLKVNVNIFLHLPSKYQNDKLFYFYYLKNSSNDYLLIEEFCDDDEIITFLINKNGKYISFASNRLKNDTNLILKAIKTYPSAIKYYPLGNRKELFIQLLEKDINILNYISFNEIYYGEVINKALYLNPTVLKYCSDENKKNFHLVKELVTKNGLVLEYASCDLKNNEEIVECALNNNPSSFKYASNRLRKNDNFIRKAIQGDGMMLLYTHEQIKNNIEYITMALQNNGMVIKYLPKLYKKDKKLCKIAVSSNGASIKYMSEIIKNDKEIVKIAVKCNKEPVLNYISSNLKVYRDILETAVISCPQNMLCGTLVYKYDYQLLKLALLGDINIIKNYKNKSIDDYEIIKYLVDIDGIYVLKASSKLRCNFGKVIRDLRNNNRIF